MNVFEKAMNNAAEGMLNRFLRNAGIEDIVDHPKDYKLEMSFIENGIVMKIDRKKKNGSMTVEEFKDSLNERES